VSVEPGTRWRHRDTGALIEVVRVEATGAPTWALVADIAATIPAVPSGPWIAAPELLATYEQDHTPRAPIDSIGAADVARDTPRVDAEHT
jgi:hypothetical protein